MSGDSKKSTLLSLLLLLILFAHSGVAQNSKSQLRSEKEKKLQRIEEVEKIISETTGEKQNTLGELNALNQRIEIQESLISSIRSEIQYLNDEINETNEIIESLESDLEQLKKEYAEMVYHTNKANHGINKITFLFSASSFAQLRSRLKYMEQYGDTRKKQASQILKVKEVLSMQVTSIQNQKNEKNTLLKDQINENASLVKLKKKRRSLLTTLNNKEDQLRQELEASKNAVAELDSKIREIIATELAKTDKVDYSVLSNSFARNKSKFPWPVSTGFVTQHFGQQKHAALKDVSINSEGIFIQTQQKEQVRVIFDGDVRFVRFIPGMGFTALVKHGDYYTVYGGIQNPIVKAGDELSAGDSLGEVITKAEGVSELWFEIRKGRSPLDPELWLVKSN